MKPKSSYIWRYFLEVDDSSAKCKTCHRNYSRKGRSTSAMRTHLKYMHKEQHVELCKLEENREKERVSELSSASALQQAKKQMTLEEASKKNQMWDTANPKSKKFDDLIGEMIAVQNLPFNFVEGIGFRRLMQAALPNYQLRGRQFFTEHVCEKIYSEMAKKIGQLLKQFPKLSFTTDIWSEPSANVSLLSLTAHGITEDFERMHIVLKCCTLHGHHTGDIIRDHFKMMMLDWDIHEDQLHCFVRDGGSNMVKALNLANMTDVNCAVHKLQLCVRSALEESREVKDLIGKCKKISGHFSHSQVAQDELVKIQTQQLNQPALRVVQDCVTRWNSTFYMLERLLKIKDSICLYASKHNIPQISLEEWLCLNKIVAILKPFEEITRDLSEKNSSISSVIPWIHVLKHTLQGEKEKSDASQDFKILTQKLIDDINSRFSELSSNTLYSLATYLDPRYKLKFFNEITKEQVQLELLRLLSLHESSLERSARDDSGASSPKRPRIMESSSTTDNDEPCTSCQSVTKLQSAHSQLADMLKSNSDDEEKGDNTTANTNLWKSLINDYNKENRLQLNEDPLAWWRYHSKFQAFAPIVRTYLSPPPSSVPSEQLFSGAGLIYEPLRNRLEGDKAAKLLFVKYNLPVLNFDYQ